MTVECPIIDPLADDYWSSARPSKPAIECRMAPTQSIASGRAGASVSGMQTQPKRPWWVVATSRGGALFMAVLYSAMCAIYVVLAAITHLGNIWAVILVPLLAVLAAWEWISYSYWRRRQGN